MQNKLKKYDIWQEGYAATGERSKAYCLARGVEASNFTEACISWWNEEPNRERTMGFFNPDKLTIWGCRLYPDETEARKSYG